MYKIVENETVIGYVDNPKYIRLQENGCYGFTDKEHAEGVALKGEAYMGAVAIELPESWVGEKITNLEASNATLLYESLTKGNTIS